jgi:hypothetical protein
MSRQPSVVDPSFGRAFGAGLALVLWAIYSTAAMAMIVAILEACPDTPDCATLSDKFSDGYIYGLTTLGGLVSALVVGQLGAAHPGELRVPRKGPDGPGSCAWRRAPLSPSTSSSGPVWAYLP